VEKRPSEKPMVAGKQGSVTGYRPRIVIKFKDYVELPYRDGVETMFEKLKVGPWENLSKQFPGLTVRRLWNAVPPEKIEELVAKAREVDQTYRPPNLLTYFVVDCPPNVEPETLAKAFREWPNVEKAYFDPPGQDPLPVNDADDPLCPSQLYLDPAPDGIDAHYAWGFAGGDGQGQHFIDLEQGWTLDHEDLTAHGATLLFGTLMDGSRYHGTAVLGEICAGDNTVGCVGIVPNLASVNVVSHSGDTNNVPNAILAAMIHLSYGDTVLLEVQLPAAPGPLPIETVDATFEAIRLATALGLVVIEAAGNGSVDLDAWTDASGFHSLQRGDPHFRDSGALMVGSCTAAVPHARWVSSNYGSRIDCYAWGEQIDTTSSNAAGSTTLYTTSFGGTSGASPIVTGAALAVQGIAEINLLHRFGPWQLRALLSDPANGTASANPAVDRIGVMPDLLKIIQSDAIGLAPDLYIRDHVGDTGDLHSGSISSSPDIILLSATVPDPQAAFGEGSGTENSDTLGSSAPATGPAYIYARIRNRGGTAADEVKATIYWAPVATLVTPDLWNLIGEASFPTVPVANVLTVSDALPWPTLPGAGHYCFVGLCGNPQDPAPLPADFPDWDHFYDYIRNNNNVTWRNFNITGPDPDASADPKDFVALPFLLVGAFDRVREMRFEVTARLPKGSRLFLETPLHLRGLISRQYRPEVVSKRNLIRLPLNPQGRTSIGPLPLKAKLRAPCRLLVQIPEAARKSAYEIFARQIYRDQEVGRVTWRLARQER